MVRRALFDCDQALGINCVKDELVLELRRLVEGLELHTKEREHVVAPVNSANDDLCGRVPLFLAVLCPAELFGGAVLREGVERLQLLATHLSRVIHPSDHANLKAEGGSQSASNSYVVMAKLADY